MTRLYGGVEAGGTESIYAVGDENFQVAEKVQSPTATPCKAIDKTVAFFRCFEADLAGIVIGSFDLIDIDGSPRTYGYITTTPKPHWANVDLAGLISKHFKVPIYFTTDVNSSAYGETIVCKGVKSLVYYTISMSTGASVIQNGEFTGGIDHTEANHIYVTPHPQDTTSNYTDFCPSHKGYLEGMAAGPSLKDHTSIRGGLIELNSEAWDVQAYYIAQAVARVTPLYRPQVIVFGDGVMAQEHVLKRVHDKLIVLSNGCIPVPDVTEHTVTPGVAENGSATFDSLALARKVSER